MSAVDAAERLERLERLADEPDPARRRMRALALLADRLAEEGIVPILVGGAALEHYTAGGYATKDVDLALPNAPEVDAAFADLGFDKEGRYWFREDLDLLFEAPAPAGLPGEDAQRQVVEVDGLPVEIIGLEDLILDRFRAYVHRRSDEDLRWARRLVGLYSDRLDRDYLRAKTAARPAEAAALADLLGEAR